MAAKDGKPEPTPPTDEELAHAREDFDWYAEHLLRIRPKGGGFLEPFRLNYTQRVVRAEINRLREMGIPPRIIVLKSRQVGVSTVTEGTLFHECHLWPNQSALVLSHKDTATRALFQMTKRFANEL